MARKAPIRQSMPEDHDEVEFEKRRIASMLAAFGPLRAPEVPEALPSYQRDVDSPEGCRFCGTAGVPMNRSVNKFRPEDVIFLCDYCQTIPRPEVVARTNMSLISTADLLRVHVTMFWVLENRIVERLRCDSSDQK